jgi:hypothetical protein
LKIIILLLTVILTYSVSNAVILLPGKIEEPLRADKILSQKYNLKKAQLAKRKKHFKEKHALKKQSKSKTVASAKKNIEETLESKNIKADGTPIAEPNRQIQDLKDSAN